MGELESMWLQFGNLMEGNSNGVKIGCYSVALVGLTVAIRRIRPFTSFRRPSDIPNRFIRYRQELTGTVGRVEPRGAVLMINHQPPISLGTARGDSLPVKIFGVNVSGHGVSWLQTIVAGHEVKFIPVAKRTDWVECEVNLHQQTTKKKERTINLGESLVAIEFATISEVHEPPTPYYKKLQTAEAYALRKKLGLKYYIKPTKLFLLQVAWSLNKLLSKVFSKNLQTSKKQIAVS